MSAAVGTLAWHLEQLGQHPCCYIVGRPDGGGFDQCGLWCGHTGPCTSYVPGQFLQVEPELHPLDVLRLRLASWPWHVRCAVCGARSGSVMVSAIGLMSWDIGDERRLAQETRWGFWPCGCEARELLW